MNNKKNLVILAVVLAVVIGGAVLAYNVVMPKYEAPGALPGVEESADDSGEEALQPAPDFTVTDWEGSEVRLSDFLGTPVVLNFWASWCPPCKQEMPHFDRLAAEVGERAAFMMVDLVGSNGETVEKGQAYIEEQGYTFPVYFDATQEAGSRYGIAAIPTTLFIDAEGNVVTAAQGMLSEENLRKGLALIGAMEESQ